MLSVFIEQCSQSVHPIIYETGHPEFPYGVRGTAFMVGFRGATYMVAARHSVRPELQPPLCFYADDVTSKKLPLKELFFVSRGKLDDDFAETVIYELDRSSYTDEVHSKAKLISLAEPRVEPPPLEGARVILFGAPSELNRVDYDEGEIATHVMALGGSYVSYSPETELHEAHIDSGHDLKSFDGMSGGPLFAITESAPGQFNVAFCGMAVRGSAVSQTVHFIGREWLLGTISAKLSAAAGLSDSRA